MRPLTANQLTLKAYLLALDRHLAGNPEHVLRLPDQATATTLRFNTNRLLAKVGSEGEEAASCPQRKELVPLVGKFTFSLRPVPEGEVGVFVVARLRALVEQETASPRSKLAQSLSEFQTASKEAPAFTQHALGQVALPPTISERLGALLGEAPGEERLEDTLSPEGRETAYYKR